MDFRLNEEQEMLRKMIREFAEEHIAPTAAERDEEERFDRSIFEQMAELGLTGIPWDEKYGGAGADYLSYVLAVEELSRVDASIGVTLSAHVSLASWPIYKFGTEEQKQTFLRPLAEGKKMGAYCLTEAGSGSDSAGMRTTAVRDGDHYILNGNKIFITNAGEAETYIVFAVTNPDLKHKGVTAFLLEKDMPGFSMGKKEDVRVPVANRLGEEGQGFKIAMMTLDGGRNGIAAQALGIAQGAFEHALSYAKERIQFGKPIAALQAIQFKLADMATQIEAARLLTYQAAWLEDKGLPYGKASAMSKVFAGDIAMQVTTEAVQVFGGYGYTREYPVERFMRDAKITQIYEGTNEIQRVVISNLLLKE